MKIFKKILAGVVSAAVIVSALAVPTAATLTTTPKTDQKSGKIYLPNGRYYAGYKAEIAATVTEASASASASGKSLTMGATIVAEAYINGVYTQKSKADGISGTSFSVSVDNSFSYGGSYVKANLTSAKGTYTIHDVPTFSLEVK